MAEDNGVRSISDEDFKDVTGKGISLVDFWAPWCYPCRMQGPILEKVAKRIGDKAQICKLNVDESRETAMNFGISGIPTLLVFKDGKKVQEFLGVQPEDELVSSLESFM